VEGRPQLSVKRLLTGLKNFWHPCHGGTFLKKCSKLTIERKKREGEEGGKKKRERRGGKRK
jgi:hypothetical protein